MDFCSDMWLAVDSWAFGVWAPSFRLGLHVSGRLAGVQTAGGKEWRIDGATLYAGGSLSDL